MGSTPAKVKKSIMRKLSGVWDPLRGEPRFEKIVVSLAPK